MHRLFDDDDDDDVHVMDHGMAYMPCPVSSGLMRPKRTKRPRSAANNGPHLFFSLFKRGRGQGRYDYSKSGIGPWLFLLAATAFGNCLWRALFRRPTCPAPPKGAQPALWGLPLWGHHSNGPHPPMNIIVLIILNIIIIIKSFFQGKQPSEKECEAVYKSYTV